MLCLNKSTNDQLNDIKVMTTAISHVKLLAGTASRLVGLGSGSHDAQLYSVTVSGRIVHSVLYLLVYALRRLNEGLTNDAHTHTKRI